MSSDTPTTSDEATLCDGCRVWWGGMGWDYARYPDCPNCGPCLCLNGMAGQGQTDGFCAIHEPLPRRQR